MSDRNISAKDLGVNPASGNERDVFVWFLACYLFGKRIQQGIAKRTWEVFMDNKLDSPQEISKQSWQHLVDLLGEGHYKRYDESTASGLLQMADFLNKKYEGKITNIEKECETQKEIEKRLREIKGVGPKTVEIFMRPLRKVWK